jgi:hypothetical protein
MPISTKILTRIIEADLLREPEKRQDESARCLTCGRPFLYKPTGNDDSDHFCTKRCREGYDADAPRWDGSRERNLSSWIRPLTGCRTIVGPGLGLNPWQSIIDASERKRRKIENRKNRRNKRALAMACWGKF